MENNLPIAGCSCMTLTSRSKRPYWFRTCDIDTDIWKEGAHIVYVPGGEEIVFTDRPKEKSLYSFMGMTNDEKDSWLLDGINSEGLAGGLLLLLEGTGVDRIEAEKQGLNGYVGMELVSLFLSACKTVEEVKDMAAKIRVCNIPFGGREVPATMHYFFVDMTGDEVILEASDRRKPGALKIYPKEEGIGIMTNSPVFPVQMKNLAWYMAVSPELRSFWGNGKKQSLFFDGRELQGDSHAEHLLRSTTFPASYCSYDRFVRLAILKALNDSGMEFPDERMLALGSGIMSSVYEPRSKGVYHYTGFGENQETLNAKDGFTQYLVMYDIIQKKMYMKAFDEVTFTEYSLMRCEGTPKACYRVKHEPMAGILKGN